MEKEHSGLSDAEARGLLAKYGPNVLPEKPPPSNFVIFISQLRSPLVYILLVAASITFFLGEYSDTVIICVAVFINTILGYFQEQKAGRALYALKKMLHPQARVIRGGHEIMIEASLVVPGDLIILNQGDKVAADGTLLEANRLFIAEAILTGESVPIAKEVEGKVFMGTVVTAGRGLMKVALTGEETEMGKIALSIQDADEETPLAKQLTYFSKQLTILTLVLVAFVFVIGVIDRLPIVELFTTSVALAVAAIPEGLLVALTMVLAVGTQRILHRKGLIRNLVSAETLGGVTTICADKTGTLTEGKMQVVEAVGDGDELSLQAIIANDRDDPMVMAAWDWGLTRQSFREENDSRFDAFRDKYKRVDSVPFTSEGRYFASLNENGGKKNMLYVNGAPDYLLKWSNLSSKEKGELTKKIEELSARGMRLVGMARKELPNTKKKIVDGDVKKDLEWVGILAFTDPPREGVKEALAKTAVAGIRTVVITGDYPETAKVIMSQLGIEVVDASVVTGDKLAEMKLPELQKVLSSHKTLLFARTTPDQKLKIVDALKKNGEVVAMTGDGVNDAPALTKADIGIVVGEASDVAKESADLVLLDSSFATIVATVEEGRAIFDNLRKIVLYLMSDAFAEIVVVVGAMLLQAFFIDDLPLPVTTAQILWINLVSDGFPHLALTVDPKRHNSMLMPPRDPSEKLVAKWMKVLIAAVSIVSGLSGLLMFLFVYFSTDDVTLARSVAFAVIGANTLAYVYSVRTLTDPLWKEGIFDNKWLLLAVTGGLFLLLIPFSLPSLQQFFEVTSLSLYYWGLVFVVAMFVVTFIEFFKFLYRKMNNIIVV